MKKTEISFNHISLEKLRLIAQTIALCCSKNTLSIFLKGPMGAGKTTFTQLLIKNILGNNTIVLSPTYSYMNTYGEDPKIFHFDFYRLHEPESLLELGLLEHVENAEAIRILEWPEIVEQMGVSSQLMLTFSPESDTCRSIKISGEEYLIAQLSQFNFD